MTTLLFLRANWKLAIAALLLAALTLQSYRLAHSQAATARSDAALAQQVAAYRQAALVATQDAIAAKQAKEASNVQVVTKEVVRYVTQNAPALAVVDERLRPAPGADQGDSAGRCLSILPALSTGALRLGDAAIVDGADAKAVTSNTLRLEALIAAWQGVAR